MRAITLRPGNSIADPETSTLVITEDVTLGGRRIRKGHRVTRDDVPVLADLERPVHAVLLESGDVHEDDAGARLARRWPGRASPFAARPSAGST